MFRSPQKYITILFFLDVCESPGTALLHTVADGTNMKLELENDL